MHIKRDTTIRFERKANSRILFLLATGLWSFASFAQCAMCRASLESAGDKSQVEAVNDGIVFLMAVPYILVGIIGIVIYRMYNKKK